MLGAMFLVLSRTRARGSRGWRKRGGEIVQHPLRRELLVRWRMSTELPTSTLLGPLLRARGDLLVRRGLREVQQRGGRGGRMGAGRRRGTGRR